MIANCDELVAALFWDDHAKDFAGRFKRIFGLQLGPK
jgi:hypothetical protein